MTLFLVANAPITIARELCDAHLKGMVVSAGQCLSTVKRLREGEPGTLLKHRRSFETPRTRAYDHVLHQLGEHNSSPLIPLVTAPTANITVWTGETSGNYEFVYDLFKAMQLEHMHRFLKVHPSHTLLEILHPIPKGVPEGDRTPMPWPRDCRTVDTPEAWRRLVRNRLLNWAHDNEDAHRPKHVRWTNRPVPWWFTEEDKEIFRTKAP